MGNPHSALSIISGSINWVILAAIIFFFGLRHPPTLTDDQPLDRRRVTLGLVMIGVFVVCFTPVPIVIT